MAGSPLNKTPTSSSLGGSPLSTMSTLVLETKMKAESNYNNPLTAENSTNLAALLSFVIRDDACHLARYESRQCVIVGRCLKHASEQNNLPIVLGQKYLGRH